MASPEEFKLEQKSRSLQLKEEALSRQAQHQQKTEERLQTLQNDVSKTERANQLKSQDLIKREKKYTDENLQLQKERKSLLETQQEEITSRQKPLMYIIPLILVTCIIAGYSAYDQINKKQLQFDQITVASKNIDKLANILSMTQDQVIDKSSALSNKKNELDKTKTMLQALKGTTDQLHTEITQLKSNQSTSESERTALATSAQTLTKQLSKLKEQLEDTYLTIDLNEVFIDYQENDLNVFKDALASHKALLEEKDENLNKQQIQQQVLEQSVEEKSETLSTKTEQLKKLKTEFTTVEDKLKLARIENLKILQQNRQLENKLKASLMVKQAKVKQTQPVSVDQTELKPESLPVN